MVRHTVFSQTNEEVMSIHPKKSSDLHFILCHEEC